MCYYVLACVIIYILFLGSSCTSGEFLCPEGVCMEIGLLCDGVADCSILSPPPTSHSLLPFGLDEASEEGAESCSKSFLEVKTMTFIGCYLVAILELEACNLIEKKSLHIIQ